MTAEGDAPHLVTPPARLYRVGCSVNLFVFTDWRWQRGEGRWDDPRISEMRQRIATRLGARANGDPDLVDEKLIDEQFAHEIDLTAARKRPYRVLYLAASRRSAFVEVLQDFRHSAEPLTKRLRAKIASLQQDTVEIPFEVAVDCGGAVPVSHFDRLYVGDIGIEDCDFIDLEHGDSIQYVYRPSLIQIARDEGLGNLNLGAILSSVRKFTRALSSWLFYNMRGLAGVRLGSTFGRPHENWSVFETRAQYGYQVMLHTGSRGRVELDDPELYHALKDLRIRLG